MINNIYYILIQFNTLFRSDKEKDYYQNIANKLKLDDDIQNSLNIVNTENSKYYFKYIRTEPTFEVIEE